MNTYVTTNLDKCDKGGVGHMFNDVITSYIIGELYGLTVLHYPFRTDHYHGTDNWEDFFKFYLDQPTYWWGDTRQRDRQHCEEFEFCEPPHNDGHEYFYYFSKQELDKWFLDPKPDTIYTVTRSNRVLLTDVYVWEKQGLISDGIYKKLMCMLKNKYRRTHPYQKRSDKTIIAVHIRRRDQYCEGQEQYSRKVLDILTGRLKKPAEVKIFTNGSADDTKQFMKEFQGAGFPMTVEFHKSTTTFEILADADISIMGRSAFPKLAGTFSDGIKIYQKGYIGNTEPVPPRLGAEFEDRDQSWLPIDMDYDFDSDHLMNLIEDHGF
jgi:hypothetical protein